MTPQTIPAPVYERGILPAAQELPAPVYGPVVPPEIARDLGMTPQTIPAPVYERGILPPADERGLGVWQEQIAPDLRIEGDIQELTDAMRELASVLRDDRPGERGTPAPSSAVAGQARGERRVEQHNTYYVDGGAGPLDVILARIEESTVRQIEELA